MTLNQIAAILALKQTSDDFQLPESLCSEIPSLVKLGLLGVYENNGSALSEAMSPGKEFVREYHYITTEGEKFMATIEQVGLYYQTRVKLEKDAAELIEKGKDKWTI